MSYRYQLNVEINEALDDLETRGTPWRASWIAHQICGSHTDGLGTGDHADFWRHCAYEEVRDQVRRCINRRAGDRPNVDDGQLRLPGYEHLQSYYVVRRQEEDLGVPVFDLTDEELDAKAAIYRAMGGACFAHADEIDRFRTLRAAEAAA